MGSVNIIQAICKWSNITKGSINIGLDGKEALNAVRQEWIMSAEAPDRDLVLDLRAKCRRTPVTVTWTWIRGHQDKDKPFHRLSPMAKDNVVTDGIAKSLSSLLVSRKFIATPITFPDEG